MYDIIAWAIISIVVSLIWWSMCVVASRSDDLAEKCWKESTKEEEDGEL